MTLPPCFSSSFSARSNGGIAASNYNRSLINALRHQSQQSRLFSTSINLRQSEPVSPMRTFEPRSATPELLPAVANERKPEEDPIFQCSNEERAMEDNAARMLLQLSKIVSNEISNDSGCITRGNSQDVVHKNEASHMKDELPPNFKPIHSYDRGISNIDRGSLSMTIPQSIEIRRSDLEDSFNACTNRGTLENNGTPQVVVASNPNSFSNLSSQIPPDILSKNVSFDSIGSKSVTNRFRTVSLASDEMIPEDRELSPSLNPLSSPPPSKDIKSYSFSLHESPQQISSHISRLGQHSFLLDKTELEQEALRRVLVAGGPNAKSLSEALAASSAAAVAAAVITPVPEQPRPIISFSIADHNTNNSTASKRVAGIGSVIQDPGEDRKGPFPLELPPLLLNPKKNVNKSTVGVAARLAKSSKRIVSLETKPPALIRKTAGKKNQPVHGPRAKKKVTPKKQQRHRHTGKKFSWKAYPELEEFLIENREEYLSYSARNYTIEQRDYNNRLTSRLLEHAEASGYPTLFENCAFSAVRDRIRSYYKSYVQSFKRRKERQQQQERLKKIEMNYI